MTAITRRFTQLFLLIFLFLNFLQFGQEKNRVISLPVIIQGVGLLKVKLEIFSKAGDLLYQKENTLRSPVKDLQLKIPFPVKRQRGLKIKISVIDLVDNYKIEDSILIK